MWNSLYGGELNIKVEDCDSITRSAGIREHKTEQIMAFTGDCLDRAMGIAWQCLALGWTANARSTKSKRLITNDIFIVHAIWWLLLLFFVIYFLVKKACLLCPLVLCVPMKTTCVTRCGIRVNGRDVINQVPGSKTSETRTGSRQLEARRIEKYEHKY